MVPNERTRLSLKVHDGSFRVLAPTHKGALVVSLDGLVLSTELITDLPEIVIELQLCALHAAFIDDVDALSSGPNQKRHPATALETWKVRSLSRLI